MLEYCFMEHPDPRQLEQIKALYRQEGWWDERDDADPA